MEAAPLLLWYKILLWLSVTLNTVLLTFLAFAITRIRKLTVAVDTWREAHQEMVEALGMMKPREVGECLPKSRPGSSRQAG